MWDDVGTRVGVVEFDAGYTRPRLVFDEPIARFTPAGSASNGGRFFSSMSHALAVGVHERAPLLVTSPLFPLGMGILGVFAATAAFSARRRGMGT